MLGLLLREIKTLASDRWLAVRRNLRLALFLSSVALQDALETLNEP